MDYGERKRDFYMLELLKTQKIYTNAKLQAYLLEKFSVYPSIDLTSRYAKQVNFSENNLIPFHKWFRYREGFSGKLIETLITDSKATKNEVIIDPFSGSGTTPVVASLNGFYSMGLDVNPLSTFITNVKMRKYPKKITHKCLDIFKDFDYSLICSEKKYRDIEKFFTPDNFASLCRIKENVDRINDDSLHDIFLVAFLCIIEKCSNRRRDGNGLKTVSTKITNVPLTFYEKLNEIIFDIDGARTFVKHGCCITESALNLASVYSEQFKKRHIKAGAIIFSPPYANSFDYFESYKLELVFGDFVECITDIKTFRKMAIRSFISCKLEASCNTCIDELALEIEKAIPLKERETGKKDTRTRKVPNMIKGYFADMREVIHQCSLCLEKGKKLYIVVDRSSYVGVVIPTDILLATIAETEGFSVGAIIECRKARTSAQQLNKYPYLKTCLQESIVELIKT